MCFSYLYCMSALICTFEYHSFLTLYNKIISSDNTVSVNPEFRSPEKNWLLFQISSKDLHGRVFLILLNLKFLQNINFETNSLNTCSNSLSTNIEDGKEFSPILEDNTDCVRFPIDKTKEVIILLPKEYTNRLYITHNNLVEILNTTLLITFKLFNKFTSEFVKHSRFYTSNDSRPLSHKRTESDKSNRTLKLPILFNKFNKVEILEVPKENIKRALSLKTLKIENLLNEEPKTQYEDTHEPVFNDDPRYTGYLKQIEEMECINKQENKRYLKIYKTFDYEIKFSGFITNTISLEDFVGKKDIRINNKNISLLYSDNKVINSLLKGSNNYSKEDFMTYNIILNELEDILKDNVKRLQSVYLEYNSLFKLYNNYNEKQNYTESKKPKKRVRGKRNTKKEPEIKQQEEISNNTQESNIAELIRSLELEDNGIQLTYYSSPNTYNLELNLYNVNLDRFDIAEFREDSFGLLEITYLEITPLLEHSLIYVRTIIYNFKQNSIFSNYSSEKLKKLLNNLVYLRIEFDLLLTEINKINENMLEENTLFPKNSIFISSNILYGIFMDELHNKSKDNKLKVFVKSTTPEELELQRLEVKLRDMLLGLNAYIYKPCNREENKENNWMIGIDTGNLLARNLPFDFTNYKRVFKYLADELFKDNKQKTLFYKINVLLLVFRRERMLFN